MNIICNTIALIASVGLFSACHTWPLQPEGARSTWSIADYRRYIEDLERKVETIRQSCPSAAVNETVISVAQLEKEQSTFFDGFYSKYQMIFDSLVPLYMSCRSAVRRTVDQELIQDDREEFKANLCSSLRLEAEGPDDAPGIPQWRDPWCDDDESTAPLEELPLSIDSRELTAARQAEQEVHEAKEEQQRAMTVAEQSKTGIARPLAEREVAGANWQGLWSNSKPQGLLNRTLLITNETSDSFKFDLKVVTGDHQGEVDGIAQIKVLKATFRNEKSDPLCVLQFQIKQSGIDVDEPDGNCQEWRGIGTTFNGLYSQVPAEELFQILKEYNKIFAIPPSERELDSIRIDDGDDFLSYDDIGFIERVMEGAMAMAMASDVSDEQLATIYQTVHQKLKAESSPPQYVLEMIFPLYQKKSEQSLRALGRLPAGSRQQIQSFMKDMGRISNSGKP